jgi:uncharacterized protein YndB with AHSA1/START domain
MSRNMRNHMNKGLVAKTSIIINVPIEKVWDALINPDKIKLYFFGAQAMSEWKVGSQIVWKGEWQGKRFEDKGKILKKEANRVLQFSHFSPLTGDPDLPENYHTVTIELSNNDTGQTTINLSQDNNSTEEAREHSEKNWNTMLKSLKKMLENSSN